MIVLEDNPILEFLVDGGGQLLATAAVNMLPLETSCHHHPTITIQRKIKRRKSYSFSIIMQHIVSNCQNCNLCKNNVLMDKGMTGKIKKELSTLSARKLTIN